PCAPRSPSMSDTLPAPDSRTAQSASAPTRELAECQAASLAGVAPGDFIDRYQVRELLGAGGMGQVFRASDAELGRDVALKLVRPRGFAPSSSDRSRLFREAQALAKLQHPNVVAIHDVGIDGDQVFIAMDFIAGSTLASWLAESDRPRPWRAI